MYTFMNSNPFLTVQLVPWAVSGLLGAVVARVIYFREGNHNHIGVVIAIVFHLLKNPMSFSSTFVSVHIFSV